MGLMTPWLAEGIVRMDEVITVPESPLPESLAITSIKQSTTAWRPASIYEKTMTITLTPRTYDGIIIIISYAASARAFIISNR